MGREMVSHLNGHVRFRAWDDRRRRLFIARDRFGEKPLHWGVFDGALLFASEPKVRLAHPSGAAQLEFQRAAPIPPFDYVPAPLSIYEGISKLPAAHTLTLEEGKIQVERYFAAEL